jgi:hypothetical protein
MMLSRRSGRRLPNRSAQRKGADERLRACVTCSRRSESGLSRQNPQCWRGGDLLSIACRHASEPAAAHEPTPMNPIVIETIGYLAAAANVFVFVSNTMIPLRVAASVANALFAVYFFINGYYSLCALNSFLLPVNLVRLKQMRDLVDHMRRANSEGAGAAFDYEWLRPYMRTIKLPAGFTLHYRGDLADEAYVLLRGEVRLFEPGVILKPVAFFGEMGMFTDENRRTATAVAETDIELLAIRYDDLLQLAAQDPEFSFYLMRLMMKRMQHNLELAEHAGAWPTLPEKSHADETHER